MLPHLTLTVQSMLPGSEVTKHDDYNLVSRDGTTRCVAMLSDWPRLARLLPPETVYVLLQDTDNPSSVPHGKWYLAGREMWQMDGFRRRLKVESKRLMDCGEAGCVTCQFANYATPQGVL